MSDIMSVTWPGDGLYADTEYHRPRPSTSTSNDAVSPVTATLPSVPSQSNRDSPIPGMTSVSMRPTIPATGSPNSLANASLTSRNT
jgi:hypothetical protein